MPVKKTKPKAKKKPTKKKVVKKKKAVKAPAKKKKNKKIKEDIKKAVDKIPGLMVEQVKVPEEKPEPAPVAHKKVIQRHYHQPGKLPWLWLGVIIFSAAIFGIWGLNMYSFIQDAYQEPKTTLNPLQESTLEFKEIFQEEEENTESIKESLRNGLALLFSAIASSTPATTTDSIVVTTTEQITTSTNDIDVSL